MNLLNACLTSFGKSRMNIQSLRIMRLTAVLLLAVFLQVSARGVAQKVTLSEKKVTLQKLFKKINQQTGFQFFYDDELLDKVERVDIEVKNMPLEQALNLIFNNLYVTYSIVEKAIILKEKPVIPGPKKEEYIPLALDIKGRVTDEAGVPLSGASIKVKGTNIGTTTNTNGEFSINVKPGSTLEISFIGYRTIEIKVSKSEILNISLSPKEIKADEIVVVAFGTQKKSSVLSSVSTVTSKEILQTPTANITNALAGRLPGLMSLQTSGNPGADAATLLIRGKSTLGNASPLVLVDGVERDFTGIDANEVASINILKDASATAVYGIRGANGVILVTTKRGKAGKTQINFSANSDFQQLTNYPDLVNSYQFALLKNEAYKNENPAAPSFQYPETTLQAYKNHTDPYLYPDVNNKNAFLKDFSGMQEYNLNISGGNKLVKYFVSGSFLNQRGIFKKIDEKKFDEALNYKRYNFRSNLDFDLSPQTRVSINLSVRNDLRKSPYDLGIGNDATSTIFSTIMRLPANAMPLVNPDGSYSFPNGSIVDPETASISGGVYPYLVSGASRKAYGNLTDASVVLTQNLNNLLKGLSFTLNGSISNGYTQVAIISPNVGILSQPRYAILSKNANGTYNYGTMQGQRYSSIVSSEANTLNKKMWYAEAKVNYEGSTGKHHYTGLAVVNAQRNLVPPLWPSSYRGMVGRVTYDYDIRYLVEASLGVNGSENFAPGKRTGFFPSYSIGWLASNEGFLRNSKIINYLKIRATLGKTGNDQGIGRFLYFDNPYTQSGNYVFGLTNNNTVSGFNEGVAGNPNVTWEEAKKYNLGVETRLFGNLLSITADVFYEKREKILISLGTVPSIYGQSVPAANLGIVENKGYELSVRHDYNIGKFNYYVNANMSFAHNNILYRDEPAQVYPNLSKTGHPVDQNFGLQVLGLFRTQEEVDAWYAKGYSTVFSNKTANGKLMPGDFIYKDINNDKVIDNNDFSAIGYPVSSSLPNGFPSPLPTPEYMMGLNFGGSYKRLDFNVLLQGATHASAYISREAAFAFFNGGSVNTYIYENRFRPEIAPLAKYPRLSTKPVLIDYNYQINDFWVMDASYLRLKQMQVGYAFTKSLLDKWHLNTLRVYLSGTNLITWSQLNKWNVDPENRDPRGWAYPQQKVYRLGLNLSF